MNFQPIIKWSGSKRKENNMTYLDLIKKLRLVDQKFIITKNDTNLKTFDDIQKEIEKIEPKYYLYKSDMRDSVYYDEMKEDRYILNERDFEIAITDNCLNLLFTDYEECDMDCNGCWRTEIDDKIKEKYELI